VPGDGDRNCRVPRSPGANARQQTMTDIDRARARIRCPEGL